MSEDLREAAELPISFARLELFELDCGDRRMADCPGLIELGKLCRIAKDSVGLSLIERIISFRKMSEERNCIDDDVAWTLLMEALKELQRVEGES